HLAVKIERSARGPTVEPAPRELDCLLGIAPEPAVMERLLDQPPLPEPEVALAVDQAVAINLAKDPLLRFPLEKAFPCGDEHLADEVGVVDHVATIGSDMNVSDVSVKPGHLLKKHQRLPQRTKSDSQPEEPVTWSRRIVIHRDLAATVQRCGLPRKYR